MQRKGFGKSIQNRVLLQSVIRERDERGGLINSPYHELRFTLHTIKCGQPCNCSLYLEACTSFQIS